MQSFARTTRAEKNPNYDSTQLCDTLCGFLISTNDRRMKNSLTDFLRSLIIRRLKKSAKLPRSNKLHLKSFKSRANTNRVIFLLFIVIVVFLILLTSNFFCKSAQKYPLQRSINFLFDNTLYKKLFGNYKGSIMFYYYDIQLEFC